MFSFLVMDEKIMTTLKKVTLWLLFYNEKNLLVRQNTTEVTDISFGLQYKPQSNLASHNFMRQSLVEDNNNF